MGDFFSNSSGQFLGKTKKNKCNVMTAKLAYK
jgi:hypothetical protein